MGFNCTFHLPVCFCLFSIYNFLRSSYLALDVTSLLHLMKTRNKLPTLQLQDSKHETETTIIYDDCWFYRRYTFSLQTIRYTTSHSKLFPSIWWSPWMKLVFSCLLFGFCFFVYYVHWRGSLFVFAITWLLEETAGEWGGGAPHRSSQTTLKGVNTDNSCKEYTFRIRWEEVFSFCRQQKLLKFFFPNHLPVVTFNALK